MVLSSRGLKTGRPRKVGRFVETLQIVTCFF
jgi:hypothetical protein